MLSRIDDCVYHWTGTQLQQMIITKAWERKGNRNDFRPIFGDRSYVNRILTPCLSPFLHDRCFHLIIVSRSRQFPANHSKAYRRIRPWNKSILHQLLVQSLVEPLLLLLPLGALIQHRISTLVSIPKSKFEFIHATTVKATERRSLQRSMSSRR